MKLVRFVCFAFLSFALLNTPPASAFNVEANNEIDIGISPDQVDALLGDTGAGKNTDAVSKARQEMLTHMAKLLTKILGRNNPAWNKTNPKWQIVYAKVYADLEEDRRPQSAEARLAANELKEDIAQNMGRADAAAIIAFYKTDTGKRYLDFDKRIGPILLDATDALLEATPETLASDLSPQEQASPHARMVKESRTFQTSWEMMKALLATHPGILAPCNIALNVMVTAAIKEHPKEIEALYREYGKDVDKFADFNESAAEKDWLESLMGALTRISAKLRMNVPPNFMRHRDEWKALYKKETGFESALP